MKKTNITLMLMSLVFIGANAGRHEEAVQTMAPWALEKPLRSGRRSPLNAERRLACVAIARERSYSPTKGHSMPTPEELFDATGVECTPRCSSPLNGKVRLSPVPLPVRLPVRNPEEEEAAYAPAE